ncbi:MAG: hypothetical protein ACLU1U_07055, partial [Lachnospiraceae bacterium]
TTAAIGISTAPATPSFGKQNMRRSQRRFIQSAALFPYSRKNKKPSVQTAFCCGVKLIFVKRAL